PNQRHPFRLEKGQAGSSRQEIGNGGDDRKSNRVPPRLLPGTLSEQSTLDLFAEPLRSRWHYKTPLNSNCANRCSMRVLWAAVGLFHQRTLGEAPVSERGWSLPSQSEGNSRQQGASQSTASCPLRLRERAETARLSRPVPVGSEADMRRRAPST